MYNSNSVGEHKDNARPQNGVRAWKGDGWVGSSLREKCGKEGAEKGEQMCLHLKVGGGGDLEQIVN